jgi:hypothetical protein
MQAEVGSFTTSHIPTPATFTSRASTATFYDSAGIIQTAASGVARSNAFFPDSNGVMRPAGLLLEAAGTNLFLNSQTFSGSSGTRTWGLAGSGSISQNAGTAPDGTNTAVLLTDTSGSSYLFSDSSGFPAAWGAGTFVRCMSVFVKANTASSFILQQGGGADYQVAFNIGPNDPSQTFTNGYSIKLPNGWFRVVINKVTADGGAMLLQVGGTTPGQSVYIWGAQGELNSYATSYIPTTGSTVTRAADVSTSATVTRSADVAQITGTNFSSWYRQEGGTVFIDYKRYPANTYTYPTPWTIRDSVGGAYLNGIQVFGEAGATYDRLSGTNFTATPSVALPNPYSRLDKNAAAFTNGSQNMAVNGTLGTASSSNIYAFGTVNQLLIGSNFTFKRLTYWPTRLSDATLQTITA